MVLAMNDCTCLLAMSIVSRVSQKYVFFKHRRSLNIGRGKLVALEVARGLHYLHANRITHFDIKSPVRMRVFFCCNVLPFLVTVGATVAADYP